MQISPIKNLNFEKPSRNLSNRTKVKILEKNFFWISPKKKFASASAQSPRKCSNIKILAKIEGKEAKFFSKIYEGHKRIWFRSKKFKIISWLCTFKMKEYCEDRSPIKGLPLYEFYVMKCYLKRFMMVSRFLPSSQEDVQYRCFN